MNRRKTLRTGIIGISSIPFLSTTMVKEHTNPSIAQILLQRYPGIRRNIQTAIYDQLADAELRKMPNGMNSIAWNIWHMARAEDVGINRLVTNGQQVFDRDEYMGKLSIDIRHFGTGMTSKEVEVLSEIIDLNMLRNYHEEVGKQTLEVFKRLDQIDLESKINENYLHQVMIKEGVLHKNALWVEDFYRTKIRSWFLVHMGLTHSFEHLGQIMILRKLLGHKGTR